LSWLDEFRRRGEEAARRRLGEPAPPTRRIVTPVTAVTHVQPDRGEATPRGKLETIWIQTRAPTEYDPGAVELGYYSVESGVVVMRDESGKATGLRHVLKAGEDPATIARVLKRTAWEKADGDANFNRRIEYPVYGVACSGGRGYLLQLRLFVCLFV
jgi:hypothetical protein